ncbi:MAG: PAS domain-containing protein [Desulfomonilaceae bacterium]
MEDNRKTRKQLIEELNQLRLKVARMEQASNIPHNSQRRSDDELSKYREIIDKASEAILIVQDGWIKFANPACSEQSGFSIAELMGHNVLDTWVHPDDRRLIEEYQKRRLTGDDSVVRYESRLLRKDGTTQWVELNSSLIMWEGRPASVCFLTDVTLRKNAETALTLANEYWERTFNAIPDLVAIIDNGYKIVRANRAMAYRLGIGQDACVGQLCYRVVHGSDKPPKFCPHALLLEDSGEHFVEVCEQRLGGYFLVSVSPIPDSDGKPLGCVHIARDIGERKREAEEKDRLIRELQRALAEVKKLSGLIPICASCKKIRNDKGYWQQVDEYVSANSDAQFTHSICPDCSRRLYPELYEDEPEQE